MVKLIVTDLDNTLLDRNGELTDYSANVLLRLKSKGILLAFATGRPERTVRRFRERLNPEYVIVNNGAIVYEGIKPLTKLFIPTNTQNELIKELLTFKEVMQISVETEECYYSNYDDSKQIPYVWQILNIKYNDMKNGIADKAPQMSISCSNPNILPYLAKKYGIRFYGNTGANWYQLVHNDTSKINGVRIVCSRLGIALSDVIAFGDDLNDFEMIRDCGIGVAMANAADEIKAVAKCKCGYHYGDGVAKWIEKNILNRN